MFGYDRCPNCNLYYLTQDFDRSICIECSPSSRERQTPVPLSKVQYKKIYEKRLSSVKIILKPTQPVFPSDVLV